LGNEEFKEGRGYNEGCFVHIRVEYMTLDIEWRLQVEGRIASAKMFYPPMLCFLGTMIGSRTLKVLSG
jgi:hypothetical protein